MKESNFPFFIVGCVRSGTTLIRHIVESHPNLICPEETQFYRWNSSFGTKQFEHTILNNKVFQLHRSIDGVSEIEMKKLFRRSKTKSQLLTNYIKLFAQKKGVENYRWFDKSPQNIFGLLSVFTDFPKCKIILNFRDPLNVCASLKEGLIVKTESLQQSVNFWNESNKVALLLKKKFTDRIYLMHYKKLTNNPLEELKKICAFLEIDFEKLTYNFSQVHNEKNKAEKVFSKEEIKFVNLRCEQTYLKLQRWSN